MKQAFLFTIIALLLGLTTTMTMDVESHLNSYHVANVDYDADGDHEANAHHQLEHIEIDFQIPLLAVREYPRVELGSAVPVFIPHLRPKRFSNSVFRPPIA